MCGRYGLWSPLQTLRQRYGIQDTGQPGLPLAPVAPRYNIAPTQAAIVVHESPTLGRRELTTMQWGLTPAWAAQSGKHSPTPINAKRESLGGRFWHRYVAGGGRCIVPADGWYEWRLEQGAKQPVPAARRRR